MATEWTVEQNLSCEEILAGSAYLRKPKAFMHIMSRAASDMMAELIDISRQCKAIKRKDGWFYCTVKKIQREINLDKDGQARALLELRGKKDSKSPPTMPEYITVEKRGMPAIRYIRINYKTLNKQVGKVANIRDEEEDSSIDIELSRDRKSRSLVVEEVRRPVVEEVRRLYKKKQPNGRNNHSRDSCGIDGRVFSSLKSGKVKTTDQDREWAEKLRESIRVATKLNRKYYLIYWVREFAGLRDEMEQNTKKIGEVLDWYCKNIGEEFVPGAYTAKEFREKFNRIEAAMKRKSKSSPFKNGRATAEEEEEEKVIW